MASNGLFQLNLPVIQRIVGEHQNQLTEERRKESAKDEKVVFRELIALFDSLLTVDAERVATVIESAFQSSLEKEESRFHNFSLVIAPPQEANDWDDIYFFQHWQELKNLTKLAPSLEGRNLTFFVWFDSENAPQIWGFGRYTLDFCCLRIETFSSGQLIVKCEMVPDEKDGILYLLELTKTAFINNRSLFHDASPDVFQQEHSVNVIKSLHNGEIPDAKEFAKGLIRYIATSDDYKTIAKEMRRHGHGGTLLVVTSTEDMLKSCDKPIFYMANPVYSELSKSLEEEAQKFAETSEKKIQNVFANSFTNHYAIEKKRDLLRLVSQLTAVDGATVITRAFDVLAFGAKIRPVNAKIKPETVLAQESFDGSRENEIALGKLGGTRHQSAAQFVFDQRESSFAIVASQDGRISVMYWDNAREMVKVIQHAEYAFA